jgi:tetratricopeptide (TPR) repeat protein
MGSRSLGRIHSPPVEDKFANQLDCIFISHYWHTPEHPDPQGEDLRLLHERLHIGLWSHVSYFWVDWTCMPQQERTEMQRQYFKRALKRIPTLVRDCTFTWRFPKFEPRLWVLFEVAEFTLNRSRPGPLADIEPFMIHLSEMNRVGVKFVIDKHGYECTNQSDSQLVIGWLEILLALYKIVPSIRTRRDILNAIDDPMVGTCLHEESGIAIDKDKGIVTANGKTYEFNPLPSETADNSASGAHVCIKGHYETELSYALRRAEVIEDDQGVEELAREYDREGEYKIAEVLHRQSLAGKEKTLGKDDINTVVSVIFLAEILEKQGQYKEAEELYRRAVTTTEQMYGPDGGGTLESRRSLAAVVQKRKLSDLYDRWKLEPLENILGINRPNSPASRRKCFPILRPRSKQAGAGKTRQQTLDQSVPDSEDLAILRCMEQNALGLEEQEKFKEAMETHWHVLERRKEMLGLDHLDTQRSMHHLARVLRREGSKATAERLYWLALAVSGKVLGPEHPDTLALMSNLAVTILMQERHAEAKEIYRQQLEREVKAFGWDHPNTYTAKFNFHNLLDENEEVRVASHVDIMGNGKATVEVRRK